MSTESETHVSKLDSNVIASESFKLNEKYVSGDAPSQAQESQESQPLELLPEIPSAAVLEVSSSPLPVAPPPEASAAKEPRQPRKSSDRHASRQGHSSGQNQSLGHNQSLSHDQSQFQAQFQTLQNYVTTLLQNYNQLKQMQSQTQNSLNIMREQNLDHLARIAEIECKVSRVEVAFAEISGLGRMVQGGSRQVQGGSRQGWRERQVYNQTQNHNQPQTHNQPQNNNQPQNQNQFQALSQERSAGPAHADNGNNSREFRAPFGRPRGRGGGQGYRQRDE